MNIFRKKILGIGFFALALFAFALVASAATVNLAWDAATDDIGVSLYEVSRSTVSGGTYSVLGTTAGTSFSDITAANSTTYYYVVRARDTSGQWGSFSNQISATTPAAPVTDTQSPSVSLTAPTNGSTVSGSVAVSASATDNVGVAGVQFKLDGANL